MDILKVAQEVQGLSRVELLRYYAKIKALPLPARNSAPLLAVITKALADGKSEMLDSFTGNVQLGTQSVPGTFCTCRYGDSIRFNFIPDEELDIEMGGEYGQLCGSIDEVSVPYNGNAQDSVGSIMRALQYAGVVPEEVPSDDPPAGKKRMKKEAEVIYKVPIVKEDDERRLIYGVVMTPDRVMSVGKDGPFLDVASAAEIEKACHAFSLNSRAIDVGHTELLSAEQASPVESFIAPVDLSWPVSGAEPKLVPAGSWVMVTKVFDDKVWAEIKGGKLNDYSIAGFADAEPLD